jgi:hypothetical protein
MYWYTLVYLILFFEAGFRGSHRDAARQATAPDHASMEEGDPSPCAEDEEFFDGRPDAEDMEEAIGKFMEGMEQQECSGFDALHKLLQGLPVPVHKNACSMTQADALKGGFLRDLTDEEKKRFTPSELLLYKHAVEYRYISVCIGTYQYKQVHTSTCCITYLYILVHTCTF